MCGSIITVLSRFSAGSYKSQRAEVHLYLCGQLFRSDTTASGREGDMLGGFLDSDTAALEYGLALTKPYISLNCIVVKNKYVAIPTAGSQALLSMDAQCLIQ